MTTTPATPPTRSTTTSTRSRRSSPEPDRAASGASRGTSRNVGLAVIVLLAAAILGGCGSTGGPTKSSTGSTPPPATADEGSDGSTIRLQRRQRLVVTLHSTYWQIGQPGSSVLAVTHEPAVAAGPGCASIPGTGCGTVTAEYVAGRAGTTALAAHRNSCGEALRCTGTAGEWRITVVVTSG